MVKAASANGWIDEVRVAMEILTGIRRAGADMNNVPRQRRGPLVKGDRMKSPGMHPQAAGERKFHDQRMVQADFSQAPFTIAWGVICACAFACKHCRANAQHVSHPNQLNTQERQKADRPPGSLWQPNPDFHRRRPDDSP